MNLPVPVTILNSFSSVGVSVSIPSMIPFFSIEARKAKRVAMASLTVVASKLYKRKMNTSPMAISRTGELNIVTD